MTKSDLIAAVATRAQSSRSATEEVVNLIFDTMKDALVRGERVELRGFASLATKDYPGYTGRNPRSGEKIAVHPKRLPVLKVGKELQRRLNS